jgi:hypothetical protein
MLPLTEIKEGHDGGFLVLWGITFEDLFYEPLILWCEFKGDGGVIVVGISVLNEGVSRRMGRGSIDLHVPLQVLRCGLGESLRRVGLVAVNVVVLNDARIWQRAESFWTPLLAMLLFTQCRCHKANFGLDRNSLLGKPPIDVRPRLSQHAGWQ